MPLPHYDPIAPVYHAPIMLQGSEYQGGTKTITIEALLAQEPYFSARELRKHTLLLPDTGFGQEVAGRILMLGLPVPHRILKRGQSIEILRLSDYQVNSLNYHNGQMGVGHFIFAGMARFHLNTAWREDWLNNRHTFHVMWIPGDYQCPPHLL